MKRGGLEMTAIRGQVVLSINTATKQAFSPPKAAGGN